MDNCLPMANKSSVLLFASLGNYLLRDATSIPWISHGGLGQIVEHCGPAHPVITPKYPPKVQMPWLSSVLLGYSMGCSPRAWDRIDCLISWLVV